MGTLAYLCSGIETIFEEFRNNLRSIPDDVRLVISVICIVLIFATLISAIKKNWSPKNEKKRNLALFLLVLVLIVILIVINSVK
jgi:uncharacterized membrane protein